MLCLCLFFFVIFIHSFFSPLFWGSIKSAERFDRLRDGQEHSFLKDIGEAAAAVFLAANAAGDVEAAVAGLVVAGPANIKQQLVGGYLDARLQGLVLAVLDTQHSGDTGVSEAVAKAAGVLAAKEHEQDERVLGLFFKHLQGTTGLAAYGVREVVMAVECGAVAQLLLHAPSAQQLPAPAGAMADLLAWAEAECPVHGIELCTISDATESGTRFVRDFGGVGGLLRYPLEVQHLVDLEDDDEDDVDDDGDGRQHVGQTEAVARTATPPLPVQPVRRPPAVLTLSIAGGSSSSASPSPASVPDSWEDVAAPPPPPVPRPVGLNPAATPFVPSWLAPKN